MMKECVTLNYLDIIRDLGVTDKESQSHETQATVFSRVLSSQRGEQESRRNTTYITSLAVKRIWLNILSHQLEWRGRTLVYYW